ncbi:Aste57867_9187 [Aphanomyces stellatus]|uniref:Aste57867_9187 protein n=1 Tax=Aphanomyces stellatus TaxID=120398 RepID=A0A485KM90_9STRA|nr:hypothetical protein As57867_009151 [Aphanomyces stellatus]VFT86070.1 Aste57867_9187 [Aphanomyces stellatus]
MGFNAAPLPSLSLHGKAKLHLHDFPPQAGLWVVQAAAMGWPHAANFAVHDTHIEVDIGGNPWYPTGEDAVNARRLMLHILRCLLSHGFQLYCASVIDNHPGAHDVLYFEPCTPCLHAAMVAVSINQHDLLRLVDAPPNLVALVTTVVTHTYTGGAVRVSEYAPGCWQFKLDGSPWGEYTSGLFSSKAPPAARSPAGQLVLATLFAQLRLSGFRLCASLTQSYSVDGRNVKDSWYFAHTPQGGSLRAGTMQ